MISDAEKRSMALWAVFGRHLLGCALAPLGEPERALEELHRSRRQAAALENRVFLPMTLIFEAQALASLGEFDAALDRLAESLRIVEATEERWWEAEAHRVRGEVLRQSGAPPEACDREFRHAIEVALSQGAHHLASRATNGLSEMNRNPRDGWRRAEF
jgi:predicted ATPase